jgi:lactate dehydrogenase-like 2-hydroxyacid dehydrogenase
MQCGDWQYNNSIDSNGEDIMSVQITIIGMGQVGTSMGWRLQNKNPSNVWGLIRIMEERALPTRLARWTRPTLTCHLQ